MWEGRGDNACGRGGVTMHVRGEGDNACVYACACTEIGQPITAVSKLC